LTSPLLSLGAAALAAVLVAAPARAGDDRTISFYHIHTKETLTIQYKKDGRFLPDALEKINHIMRDWRQNKTIAIDPNTVDIIWEMHRELGSQEPVNIICGYRSPATNEMLRRTRGGQASQSQHMTGKAIDIAFPDVPVKRLRYSAMIRERGGVGYYPTSGIPFVHVDTGRVRHWPRMVRDELALLFPSGHSKYEPADGRPITPADVRSARERRKDLAQEVSQFFALRDAPKGPIQVAEAAPRVTKLPVPEPKAAMRPLASRERMSVTPLPPVETAAPAVNPSVVALLSSGAAPVAPPAKAIEAAMPIPPAPKLVAAPRPVDRPSKFVAKLPDADRSRLDQLVKLASLEAAPAPPAAKPPLVTGSTGRTEKAAALLAAPLKTASMTPGWPFGKKPAVTEAPPPVTEAESEHPFGAGSSDWRSGWTVAPEYDDDHPDELSYRPFALAPLLTETSSFDDPALATLVAPDADAALDMLDDEDAAVPMQFGRDHVSTAMAWAQQFSGDAVHLAGLAAAPAPEERAPQLAARSVKTEAR
jgi:uncharacterized protein YcbK (DUF882 family)